MGLEISKRDNGSRQVNTSSQQIYKNRVADRRYQPFDKNRRPSGSSSRVLDPVRSRINELKRDTDMAGQRDDISQARLELSLNKLQLNHQDLKSDLHNLSKTYQGLREHYEECYKYYNESGMKQKGIDRKSYEDNYKQTNEEVKRYLSDLENHDAAHSEYRRVSQERLVIVERQGDSLITRDINENDVDEIVDENVNRRIQTSYRELLVKARSLNNAIASFQRDGGELGDNSVEDQMIHRQMRHLLANCTHHMILLETINTTRDDIRNNTPDAIRRENERMWNERWAELSHQLEQAQENYRKASLQREEAYKDYESNYDELLNKSRLYDRARRDFSSQSVNPEVLLWTSRKLTKELPKESDLTDREQQSRVRHARNEHDRLQKLYQTMRKKDALFAAHLRQLKKDALEAL